MITKKSKVFLPLKVLGAGGRDTSKEKGIGQYFLDGLPNREVAWITYRTYTSERERSRVRTFDEFRELYMKALLKVRDTMDKESLKDQLFKKLGDEEASKPPKEVGRAKRGIRGTGKYGRLHQVSMEQEPEWEEYPEEYEDEETLQAREKEELETPVPVEEQEDSDVEADWLHGVSMDPQGRRPGVCYKFAKTGKCDTRDCMYSHDPEDVRAYKALKAVGKDKFTTVQRQWGNMKSSPEIKVATATPTASTPRLPGDARRRS